MGNLTNSLKRFFANKNTVTILGVLAGILVLYFGYRYRIESATTPITVPIAKETIDAKATITEDLITSITMPKDQVGKLDNLIVNRAQVRGMCVKYNTVIPKNGLFYKDNVISCDEQPNSNAANMPDGYKNFKLNVSTLSDTGAPVGNSVMPGDYIDLYLKIIFRTGENATKVFFGPFINSIKVLDVLDSTGERAFEGNTVKRAAYYEFAVDDEMNYVLELAATVKNKGFADINLVPVVRNKKYTTDAAPTEFANGALVERIKQYGINIGE